MIVCVVECGEVHISPKSFTRAEELALPKGVIRGTVVQSDDTVVSMAAATHGNSPMTSDRPEAGEASRGVNIE